MRNSRFSRPRMLFAISLVAASLSGCGSAHDDAAPVASTPDNAAPPASPSAPAQASSNGEIRFTSGTSYAATGGRAEIALSVSETRAHDVLERIATASGVPLDIADGVKLDHTVSLQFDGMPLSAVLTLLGQDANAEITAEPDAIRVRPRATPMR
ncbi:MAG: hypothetical protein ACTIJY_00280 [Luteimonas sp.]